MSNVELPIAGQGKQVSSARLVFTLGFAGLVAGLALAGAYKLTKPIIDANKARALEEAVFQVVPGSETMQRLVLRDGKLTPVKHGEGAGEPTVYAAYAADGAFVGYAIEGDGPGFQDAIRLLLGYDPTRRRIVGLYILESRETPGLGDKIFKDPAFAGNFTDLAIDPSVVLVKDGRDKDNEVDAITGATISSRAVVKIVNTAINEWKDKLPPADQAPPAPSREPAAGEPSQEGGDG